MDPVSAQRFRDKLKHINGIDPDTVPDCEWNKDVTAFPAITHAETFSYLVLTVSAYTHEQFKACKSLAAYNQAYNGFVSGVQTFQPNGCPNVITTGKVLHSQRPNEKALRPWLVTQTKDDVVTVLVAHCNCMAGLGETCTHIAALMFFVEGHVRLRERTTVTGKAAYWTVPSGISKVTATKASDIVFTNPSSQRKQILHNIPIKSPKTKKRPAEPADTDVHNFLSDLTHCKGSKPVILAVHKEFQDSFITNKDIPPPFFTFKNDTLCNASYEDIRSYCSGLQIQMTPEQANIIETVTVGQSKCQLWLDMRIGRVTASKLYDVCHTQVEKPSLSLIGSIVQPTSFKSTATSWGIENEDVARNKYCTQMSADHIDFVCSPSGLHIKSDEPFLAATPDGIVSCACCGTGCLEIKCPWAAKDMSIVDALKNKKVPLIEVDSKLTLKKECSYFYQCQLQMYVTGHKFCDFVIFTLNDIFTERVYFDTDFIQACIPNARKFFYDVLLPEIVCKHFSSQRALKTIQSPETEQLYCICRKAAYGGMICCENKSCEEWFHFDCVGISKVPRGKWYCPSCKPIKKRK